MTRDWLVRLGVLLAAIALGAWVVTHTEWVEEETPMPARGAAAEDPNYALALLVRSFAYALLFGAEDFLLWLTPGAMYGVAAGAAMATIAAGFSAPVRTALAGLALMAATAIVNLAPENPYLAMFLAEWRQGHFLNFTGLTRVVSALWPFAALTWLLSLAGNRDRSRID